jgi:hypothetical protein
MAKEYEEFFGTVWENAGSFLITIPKKLAVFSGLKHGDPVRVMYKIQETPKEKNV